MLAASFGGISSFTRTELLAFQNDLISNSVFAASQPVIGAALKANASSGSLFAEPANALSTVADNTTDANDVRENIKKALEAAGLEGVNVATANDSFRIQFSDTKNIPVAAFSSGLAILPISSSAFNLSLTYSIDVTVGVQGAAFYLDASATNQELQLDVSVASADLPSLQVSLGAVQAVATPRPSGFKALDATFIANIQGGQLAQGQALPITVALSGSANVQADLTIEYAVGSLHPQLNSGFVLTTGLGPAGTLPKATFSEVKLDLGPLLRGYGAYAVTNALEKAKPVFDLAAKLEKPLPGLEQLSQQIEGLVGDLNNVETGNNDLNALLGALGDPNLLNVMDAVVVFRPDYKDAVKGFTQAVREVNKVNKLLNQLSSLALGQVNFGTFHLGDAGDLRTATGSLSSQTPTLQAPASPIEGQAGVGELKSLLTNFNLSTDLLSAGKVFELLAGSDQVRILEYFYHFDKPQVTDIKFVNENFVVGIVPVNFQVSATAGIEANVRFGFSSRGIVDKNLSHGFYVGARTASSTGDAFLELKGALNVDLSIGQDYELVAARVGVRGSLNANAEVYFVEVIPNSGKLYLDQFSSQCPLGGTVDVSANVELLADISFKLDVQALINSLKSLVESAIRNNPTKLAAQEMVKAATPYLKKAGVSDADIAHLTELANNPQTALKAFSEGFQKFGVNASAEFEKLAEDVEQGKKNVEGFIKDPVGTTAGELGRAPGNILGGLGLTGGVGYQKTSVIFSQPLYRWQTGSCSGNDYGGGLSNPQGSASVQSFVPVLGEVKDGKLIIYVGPLAGKRSAEVGPGEIDENVIVTPVDPGAPGNGKVLVSMFGYTQEFSGVTEVEADAGDGNNSVDARGLALPVRFYGGAGNDTFHAGTKTAFLSGGDGINTLVGSPEDDSLWGGNDRDIVTGLAGDDYVVTFNGDDAVSGDYELGSPEDLAVSANPNGNDRIETGDGNDYVYAGGGDDWVDLGLGNDIGYGGAGEDTIYGSGGHDRIKGGAGPDFLYSGQGNAVIDGGDGDDRINAGPGINLLAGGIGNDFLVGGNAIDVFYYAQGDGEDAIDGAGGLNGIMVDLVASGASISLDAVGAGTKLSGDAGGSFSLNLADIQEHILSVAGSGSEIKVSDLTGTFSRYVSILLGGTRTAQDRVTVDGSEVDDVVDVSVADNVLKVSGLSSQVEIRNVIAADRLTVRGRNGNDRIKAQSGVENSIGITLDGGFGDDSLSADAILIGGPGDDYLEGGLGVDQISGNEGNDVLVGGPGLDTLDGGPGVDTVLVRGTPGNDTITAAQTNSTTLNTNVNGVSDTDTVQNMEIVAIEALEGADAIAVSQADAIAGSLAFRVDGGQGATDRLIVCDEGLGDLVIQRLGPDAVSGVFTVGSLAPVHYLNVERTDISPVNSVTGTSGADGLGRVLVLPFDALEPNDLRTIAVPVGDQPTFIRGLSIDPAGQDLPAPFDDVPADEDWFEFTPAKTGMYRFEARFDEIGTLPNGRPGLPNNGNLDVRVYTSAGVLIDSSAASTSNEFVDISVAAGKRYYARISGSGQAVNVYDLAVTEVDLAGPQVTSVSITGAPNYNLFDVKPSLSGPTPGVLGLTIGITDRIARALGDLYPALATGVISPGIIQLRGDHSGLIAIKSVTLVNDPPVAGQVATAKLFITFYDYLPDDRFTLFLSDAIVDPAENSLDGDSNASTPQTISLPSGDLIAGGNFAARFTVDSRPEVGAISEGLVYVDINGNLHWDPTGEDNDATNRDLVFQFGQVADAAFAGNFAPVGAAKASGFDKLGAYGKFGSTYSFLLDTNDDGVGDFSSPMPASYQVNGIPVAGNFNAAHPGDEIGLFDGSYWYLDANGNNRIDVGERWASNFNGLPLVGDFNGDGSDDLAAFNNATNVFAFDTNRDGNSDYTWNVQDAVKRFTGLSGFTDRPVTGDLNLDGIDDIGLWVTDRAGTLPRNSGEFFFWVSDKRATNPANVFSAFSPAPLGNDLFAEFGDDFALPIFGNFDPPVTNAPGNENPLHNGSNPLDTNGDGFVSAIDVLVVINVLNLRLDLPANDPVRAFATVGYRTVDVSGDQAVSALDALLIINALNNHVAGAAEGEQSTSTFRANSVDAAFAELDTWELDALKRKRLNVGDA